MISHAERQKALAEKNRRRRRRGLATALLVMLGVTLPMFVSAFTDWWHRPFTTALAAAPEQPDIKRFTLLVLGADDRPDGTGRADTMMLAFVDLNAGSIRLLSIPRDSYAEIPGHGYYKINTAYFFGKEELARRTVENLIGLPVDYTVAVNMQGFQQIVDALGGVDIDVDEDMDYDDPSDEPPLHIHLHKGLQRLGGEDALHYVRFRHDAQSDWGRMKRQQAFLKALVHAAEQPSNLPRLPQLVKLIAGSVRTSLPAGKVAALALVARQKLSEDGVSGETLRGDDIWADDGYYLGLRFAAMRARVRELAGYPQEGLDGYVEKDEPAARAYQTELDKLRGSSDH